MKLALNLVLFLFTFFVFEKKSFSLTNYQIKKICEKEIKESACIRILQEKKSNLKRGNLIEIPVIPYKR